MSISWLSDAEKAWLACAIDGEGSVCLEDKPSYKRIRISIYNTDMNFILVARTLIERVCGRGVVKTDDSHLRQHNAGRKIFSTKPLYKVEAYGLKAYLVLKEVRPWMIIKADKADAILSAGRPASVSEHITLVNRTITPFRKRNEFGRFVKKQI